MTLYATMGSNYKSILKSFVFSRMNFVSSVLRISIARKLIGISWNMHSLSISLQKNVSDKGLKGSVVNQALSSLSISLQKNVSHKGLKGTVVNQALSSLIKGSL